jgi:hypothetical protein
MVHIGDRRFRKPLRCGVVPYSAPNEALQPTGPVVRLSKVFCLASRPGG